MRKFSPSLRGEFSFVSSEFVLLPPKFFFFFSCALSRFFPLTTLKRPSVLPSPGNFRVTGRPFPFFSAVLFFPAILRSRKPRSYLFLHLAEWPSMIISVFILSFFFLGNFPTVSPHPPFLRNFYLLFPISVLRQTFNFSFINL